MVRLYALELGLLTSVLTAHHPWRWLKAPDTQDKFVTSSWEQITATELGRVKWGSYPALFTRWSPSCLKCCAHVRPCTPWAAGVWLHLLLPSPDSPLLPAGPPRLPTLLHTCGLCGQGPDREQAGARTNCGQALPWLTGHSGGTLPKAVPAVSSSLPTGVLVAPGHKAQCYLLARMQRARSGSGENPEHGLSIFPTPTTAFH